MTPENQQQQPEQQPQGDAAGIDFDSDQPIPACPLRKPEDGEICEACQ